MNIESDGGKRGGREDKKEIELTSGELMCFISGFEASTLLQLLESGDNGREEKDNGRNFAPESGPEQTFS